MNLLCVSDGESTKRDGNDNSPTGVAHFAALRDLRVLCGVGPGFMGSEQVRMEHGALHEPDPCGVRWQSAAATPLWKSLAHPKSVVALRFPPQTMGFMVPTRGSGIVGAAHEPARNGAPARPVAAASFSAVDHERVPRLGTAQLLRLLVSRRNPRNRQPAPRRCFHGYTSR